jgi:glycosyltransferase involved in cell wall biosynthesis
MKILLTADAFGGVWTYAAELGEQLAARGNDVVIAALGRAPSAEQRALVPSVELHVWEGALEWMHDPWDDVAASGEWLLDLADDLRPDVVHVNGYAHAALEFPSPVVVVAHSCVLSWLRAVRGHDAPPEWTRYRVETERGLRAADVVVAPTNAMLAALRREYAFATPAVVIPNGRRTPRAQEKLPFVLAAGRVWDEAKNIAAVERVAPRLPWPVRIAGEGSALGHVEQQVLEAWLGEASIFALPARYEPFGLGALEAAGAGCALVLGGVASLHEVWGDAAAYVDPDDDTALADTLLRLIDETPLRKRYARAAQTRALELTPERMAAAYLALYDRLAARVDELERV